MFGRLAVLVSCLSFAIPSIAAITGTVMTSDGVPIAGARVSIYALETAAARRVRYQSDTPERKPLATLETAKNGRFSIDSPKDQQVVTVQIEAAGYAPYATRVERDDEIGAVALIQAATKSARVTAGGKPVAGARVIWMSGAELVTTTDDEGKYSLPDPEKWGSRVVVIHPDYAISDVTRRMNDLTIDRQLDAGVALSGRVLSRDGTTPVADAAITVDGWVMAGSGENGAFTIAHAPKDWAWIGATSGTLAGRRARGGGLDIRLQAAATVTGTVRDSKSSAPIAGANIMPVQFNRPGETESALTDAKGNYTIFDAPPGSYTLTATHPGYEITRVEVTVGPAASASRNLVGTRLARIYGTVVDEEKRPIAGARVSQSVSRTGPGPFFASAPAQPSISAPDGTFILDGTPNSDLLIHARKKGRPSAQSASLRLEPGERKKGVVITMPAGFPVTGRVTNRDEQPLAGVEIMATEARSGGPMGVQFMMASRRGRQSDDVVRTGDDGTFSFNLAEGKYDIGFRREGFATKALRAQEVGPAMRPLSVTLEPGVSITGRVTRGGTGVPGVMVNLMSDSARDSVETAADGSFVLSDLTPGQAMLFAVKSDEFIQQNQPVTAPAQDVVIEIPPGGRISGRVVDKETKAPVTTFDAGVTSARGGGGMIFAGPTRQRPFTSDDGTFVLDNVPVGPQSLVVNAAGYTSTTIPAIQVEEGKSTPEITVEMDRGTRVVGRVTGPNGSPLAGVGIRLNPSSGRMVRPPMPSFGSSAVTDTNGEYVIDAVEQGERTLTFALTGYVSTDRTAEVKGRETRIDAQLSTGLRVTGVVVTEGGAPVAEATVTTRSGSGGLSNTRSDQSGTFQMEGLAPGRYSFRAHKEGYPGAELSDVDVTSGAPIRLVMRSGGTIYGRVIGLEPSEFANTTVMANSPNGGASAAVDPSGNFRIEGAPVGTVRLVAQTRQGFGMTGRRSSQKSVQVEAGSAVHADVEFRNDTVIRGRVTREGTPVANAIVHFFPRSGSGQTNERATTDNAGYYEVLGLDDSLYNVAVTDVQRRGSYSTTYEVRGSGTFDIEMRFATMRGRVVDADSGQPISGAAVNLRMPDGGFYGSRTYLTDPSGAFIADGITPGTYEVSAEKEGYGTRVSEVSVGDSPAEVEVKLTPNPAVTIRVVDARDGRMLSASVRVFDAQDRAVYEPAPRFGFTGTPDVVKIGLEPGTYRAMINAPGYAMRNVTIQAPGSHEVGLTPGGTISIRSKGSELRRARLLDASGNLYSQSPYSRGFGIDPAPGVTLLEHIAPGVYTIQLLGPRDEVTGSAQVIVREAQIAVVEL